MVINYSKERKNQPDKVVNELARGQLNRENERFPILVRPSKNAVLLRLSILLVLGLSKAFTRIVRTDRSVRGG